MHLQSISNYCKAFEKHIEYTESPWRQRQPLILMIVNRNHNCQGVVDSIRVRVGNVSRR